MSQLTVSKRFLSLEEAESVINRIPVLIGLLDDTEHKPQDHKGFVYLSRFNKDQFLEAYPDKERAKSLLQSKKTPGAEQNEEESLVIETAATHSSDSSQNLEKRRRTATSLCTLSRKPAKRQLIVSEGGIQVLLELSNSHDKVVQTKVADAFASLSTEPAIRTQMIEEGCLLAIMNLMANSNIREAKIDCCTAVCNLCCVPGLEFRMVKEGVPQAVNHIAMACPEATDIVLKSLLNVSCIPDKFARIEDITEALMYFTATPITPDQEILLLSAFCNLSAVRNNQLRLVEDGGLRVVEKYSKYPDKKHRLMASEILKNLTMDSRTRTKLLELNIINLLLQISEDDDLQIKMVCAKAFQYLAADVIFRQKIVNSDALRLIIKTSGEFTVVEMGRISAKTLKVLCFDEELGTKLVHDGVGSALVALLNTGDDTINQYCIESVCALFRDIHILKLLVSQGADEVIVSLAQSTENALTKEWCSFALYRLAISKKISARSLEHLILPCIINMSENSSELTKCFCSASLANITLMKIVDCAVAIPLLVTMLKTESSEVVKKYCASALFNLADKDENCYLMLDSEALLPIVTLTLDGHIKTKVICAGIISRLSLHKQYYSQFAEGNVLKVLLELSCVDHRLTQRRVVIALSNLSQDEDLRAQLLALNPIPYIISLASERDEYLRRGCISIVCNMSYNVGSEEAIVKAGIVPTLMITALITSDQTVSKIICVKALVNLMAEQSLYSGMVKDNVIWGLSKLVQTDDVELLTLSAKALCCFSADFSRQLLNSHVALEAVIRLIERPELHLKKSGARMLTNILLKTNENDKDFRKAVIANMRAIARTDDEELDVMCVLCLCLASQSESCRTTIVESGMLKLIDGNTIFSDPTISFAYITMFSNIANNPLMRTKVLDDRVIERFEKICVIKDIQLDLAIAKALYCVSCSAENIPKLVNQNIIPFIRSMFEQEDVENDAMDENGRPEEVIQHLIACLYNISTHLEVQNQIIQQGFVSLMVELWPIAQKDYKMCGLAYLSICHLACGRTNSARMVAENCTSILIFLTEHYKIPAFSSYSFGTDMFYRCSASLRNLLSVVGNQKTMVDAGCIESLLHIADRYTGAYSDAHVEQQGNISGSNGRHHTPSAAKKNKKYDSHYAIQVNCATALKSMTYNREIRDKLVSSGAINIILEDTKKDGADLPMSLQLLRELEAESWDNGSRGRQKDGRVTNVRPAAMFTEFLGGTSNVKLDVEMKPEELSKFYVQVLLDEPGYGDDDASMDESDQGPLSRANSVSRGSSFKSSPPKVWKPRRRRTELKDDASSPGSPPRESSLTPTSTDSALAAADEGQAAEDAEVELTMADLKGFVDPDEGTSVSGSNAMAYPKQESTLTAAEIIDSFGEVQQPDSHLQQQQEEELKSPSASRMPSVEYSEFDPNSPVEMLKGIDLRRHSRSQDGSSQQSHNANDGGSIGSFSQRGSARGGGDEKGLPQLSKADKQPYQSSSAKNLLIGRNTDTISGKNGLSASADQRGQSGFPPLGGSASMSNTGTFKVKKRPDPTKKFNKLVNLINTARKESKNSTGTNRFNESGGGSSADLGGTGDMRASSAPDVEAVVSTWRKMSQF